MATTVFTVTNFALPAAPPAYFVSGDRQNPANGSPIPAGHTRWSLTFDTTGLPIGQKFADVIVQYHYTGVVLFPNNIDAGRVTNADGSQTIIAGTTSFTGWIDDAGSSFNTTWVSTTGVLQHSAFMAFGLDRIPNAYPDLGRFLVKSTPGFATVASATLDLN